MFDCPEQSHTSPNVTSDSVALLVVVDSPPDDVAALRAVIVTLPPASRGASATRQLPSLSVVAATL